MIAANFWLENRIATETVNQDCQSVGRDVNAVYRYRDRWSDFKTEVFGKKPFVWIDMLFRFGRKNRRSGL